MATQVPFTAAEKQELAQAHAIKQRVRAQRRNRQALQDREDKLKAEKEELRLKQDRAAAEAAAEVARKAKEDLDNRTRRVLMQLMLEMKEQKVHLVKQPLAPGWGYGGQRVHVFDMVDSSDDAARPFQVYWVYNKGFEWN